MTGRGRFLGVADLRPAGRDQPNLLVPSYSGLNLEPIFSGDAASYGWSIFEPRKAPMALRRISNRSVELLQERTEHWPLRSRLMFEAQGDPNAARSNTRVAVKWVWAR
jgi:hypothetical protein